MLRYELEKYRRQWLLIILVTLALTAYYVSMAFIGSYNTITGGALTSFWEDEDARVSQMSQQTAVVDAEWIAELDNAYRQFIDENRLPPEQVQTNIDSLKSSGYQIDFDAQEALENRYGVDYSIGLLPWNVYHSMVEDYPFFEAYHIYIPFALDAAGHIHQEYDRINQLYLADGGKTYGEAMGYSDAQMADCWNLIDRVYPNFQMVIGYCYGWEVLCCTMQFLPFSLGVALLVTLGSLFSRERAVSMTSLLRTTRKGRRTLLHRKLLFAIGAATVLWLFFQGILLIAVGLTYGLDGAACTVICYNIPSVYGLNWITYYLVQCAFSYFGSLVFALFVCCLSSFLKLGITLPAGLVMTLLTGTPMNVSLNFPQAFSLTDKVKVLTPAQLMTSYPALQVYQSYSIGNFQLQLPCAMALAILMESALMLLLLEYREGGR